MRVEILAGGPASAEELAAVLAAIDVIADDAEEAPPPNRWRWAGRRWGSARSWNSRD